MISEVHNNIYRIAVPLPENPLRSLNSYLIKSDDRNLLIDTGFRRKECLDSLKEGIVKLGVKMEDTDIFITHLHADHSGLVNDIKHHDSKIYMNEQDMQYLRYTIFDQENYVEKEKAGYMLQGYPLDVWYESMENNPALDYAINKDYDIIPVVDGDKINVGDIRLTCIHTPGHTPGHTCLYIEEDSVLFSGDHILFDITPNITAWQGFDDALGAYLESLDKISKYKIEKTLSAHRENSPNTYERIDELIEHHHHRLDELISIVKADPGITGHDAASRMKWSIRAKDWSDFPATQKWFAVGEATAHLIHLEKLGKLRKELVDKTYRYYIVN